MSSQFLKPYYDAIATAAGKASLTGAFRESSELTFESEHFRGVAEISTKLRGQADAEGRVFVKPVPEGGRNISTLDALQLGGPAVVALVTGSLTLANESNPLPFAQVFVLINDAQGSYCSDDLFQFATA